MAATVSKAEAKIDTHLADCKQYRISTERRLSRIEKVIWGAIVFLVSDSYLIELIANRFSSGG